MPVPESIAMELFTFIQENPDFSFKPKTLDQVRKYSEGKPKIITVTTYDRSAAARQDCIEHYGYDCDVCGFSFEDTYGDLGIKYVEVHHLHPIADIGEEHMIDPIGDLRPVCANCHRMLHRRRPPLSIDELKAQKNQRLLTLGG